jgi:hypothetical protein
VVGVVVKGCFCHVQKMEVRRHPAKFGRQTQINAQLFSDQYVLISFEYCVMSIVAEKRLFLRI